MKISTKGRYALRLMLDLAEHQNEGYIALKDIAQRQDISKKYLEQIVPMLNRSDYLLTNRGFQGGYRLAKSPDKYTVGELLRITEGGPVARALPGAASQRLPAQRRLPPHLPSGRGSIVSSANIWTALRCRPCWSRKKSFAWPAIM